MPVPAIPDAAYLASMSVCGLEEGGPTIGVSGGGGEPRVARVVEVDAVELMRFTMPGSLDLSLYGSAPPDGGGKYC